MSYRLLLAGLIAVGIAFGAEGAEPKPIPHMQAIPLPRSELSFQRDGEEITRLYYGAELERPFLFPVNGPSGHCLTRIGHPHDADTHTHHNSVWIGHQNVDGFNFWEDKPPPRVVHQRILRIEDGDAQAFIETENAWINGEGGTVLRELRRTTVQPLAKREWLLLFDLEFHAEKKPVTFGQTGFGLIGVRMAKTIGVTDGGGVIRNSEGGVDEPACFRKPARWVDYTGPIAPGKQEGILLMDHPANAGFPSPFHVRNDGWMGAAFSFAAPVVVKPDQPLRMRYGLYMHEGRLDPARLQERWEAFAQTKFELFVEKKKPVAPAAN